MQRRWFVMVVVLAAALAGCSFTMAKNPGSWEPSREPTCERSRRKPIADTVAGSLAVGAVVWMLAERAGCHTNNCRSMTAGFAFAWGVASVPFFIAAKVGYGRAARCREAERMRREWKQGHSGPPGLTNP